MSEPQEPAGKSGRGKLALQFLLALVLGTAVAFAVVFVPPAGWTSSDVTTGKHSGYPDLTSRVYDMPVAQCVQFAAQASANLGWQVAKSDPAGGAVRAEAGSLPGPFRQEVTVTVTPDGENPRHSAVEVRSRSLLGGADLGANARNIRALQAWMDDKLPRIR